MLLAGGLLTQPSVQQHALTVIRFPFVLVRTLVSAIGLIPQLPTLARENTRLRHTLQTSQQELATLREALRQHAVASSLLETLGERPGMLASVIGGTRVQALGLALLVWFVAVLFFDLVLIGMGLTNRKERL